VVRGGHIMKVVIAGQGAFGQRHIEACQQIDGIEIVSLAGGNPKGTEEIANKYGIPHWTSYDFEGSLNQPGVEAVILATPTQQHAEQALLTMRAGKHVEIEIPMADSLADSEAICNAQKETGVVAMAGHTRRFNPSHQWIHNKIVAGELKLQQLKVETYFFRRTNMNAAGQPRSWVDHLLWHHACHTVDLFQYQTGEEISVARGVQGPLHPELNIAMDMAVQLKVPGGAVCALSLSFNNKGPQGTFFRYICDNGTYIAYYDDLYESDVAPENKIDLSEVAVSNNGIELQDREFFAAIAENREPNASVHQALSAMRALDMIENSLA
jgi:2-hydroxy-4-carboxymuconate semialdehyde hemiacetal dehydrogenase